MSSITCIPVIFILTHKYVYEQLAVSLCVCLLAESNFYCSSDECMQYVWVPEGFRQ